MIIRPARHADAAAIAAVNVQAWREAYGGGLMPDEIVARVTNERATANWTASLSTAGGTVFTHIAQVEDRVVGYVASGSQRSAGLAPSHEGEIFAIYVLAAFHRRGIARALMSVASRSLTTRGHSGVALWVLRDNHPARAFYDAIGGRVVGAREDRRDPHLLHEVAYGWATLSIELNPQGGASCPN